MWHMMKGAASAAILLLAGVQASMADDAPRRFHDLHRAQIPPDPRPSFPLNRAAEILAPDAPINVHETTDLQECGAHGGLFGGAILCQSLLPKGELVLVWDWKGSQPIDGYRVYHVEHNGGRTLVGTQSQGKGITMFAVPPPPDGYGNPCYLVTAYSGRFESKAGWDACNNTQASLVQTTSLPLARSAGVEMKYHGYTGAMHLPGLWSSRDGSFRVGHDLSHETHYNGDEAINIYAHVALLFDVSGLSGKTIRSAHLRLTIDKSNNHSAMNTDSCIRRISQPPGAWTANKDLIWQARLVAQFDEFVGPDVSYDVTSVVKGWAAGAPNYGLVLEDGDDVTVRREAFVTDTCMTDLVAEQTRLDVEYQ